ncbi:MAG: signal peptidase I [Lachnospiraceae bacterium]
MGRRRKNYKKTKKNGRIASVCGIMGTALIVIVILLCSMLVVPGIFGIHMYNVITGSMEPAIRVGSLIYIHETAPEDIEEEDIIAFYGSAGDGGIITHRVVKNNAVSGMFRTKGDANAGEDPTPVSYDDFIGRVVLAIPHMGKVLTILTSFYGKIAAVCVIIVGALLNILSSRYKEELL